MAALALRAHGEVRITPTRSPVCARTSALPAAWERRSAPETDPFRRAELAAENGCDQRYGWLIPPRTNTFQEVVAIVHAHLATDGHDVEESAMLRDLVDGGEREVDVAITGEIAGQQVVVSIEATAARRGVDRPWVEGRIAKHESLPTSRLLLVSEYGFTKPAREYAERKGAVPLTPEDLTGEDPSFEVVNKLGSVWAKVVQFTPTSVALFVHQPGSGDARWFRAPPDMTVFFDDGRQLGALVDVVRTFLQRSWGKTIDDIDLANIAENRDEYFKAQIGPPLVIRVDGIEHRLCLRWEESAEPELHKLDRADVLGGAKIWVTEMSLTHRRLQTTMYAFGEGIVGGQDALFVITEGDEGAKATMRLRPNTGRNAAPSCPSIPHVGD